MMIQFDKARELIETTLLMGRRSMLEPDAMALMSIMGIPVPSFHLASSIGEAQKIAEALGYPIVLKVVSPDIIHKSDVGGVKLNIVNSHQVSEKFNEILKNIREKAPGAKVSGMMVQKMVPSTTEVVVGALRDRQFGPVLMFGLGGIFIELLKDLSFRVAPVNKDDALDMIREIRGYPILIGYRGSPKLDTDAIADVIVKVSELMMSIDEIDQIDLNPIMVYPSGLVALDIRIIPAYKSGG